VTFRPAAPATVRAPDRAVRRGRTARTGPRSIRAAIRAARVIADQHWTTRTARTGSTPARRTAPRTRAGSRTTILAEQSAVR